MFDKCDRASFDTLDKWKRDFIKHCDPKDPNEYPFIVLGNKCDLADDISVKTEAAKDWCVANGNMPYVETSAKDNVGVDEAFSILIKRALKNDQDHKLDLPNHIKITRNQNSDEKSGTDISKNIKKKKKCC